MRTFIGRQYMRDKPGKTETVVGAAILLLLAVIVISFAAVALSPAEPLFDVRIAEENQPANSRAQTVAGWMMPPLGTAGWTSPGEGGSAPIKVWDRRGILDSDPDDHTFTDFDADLLYRGRYTSLDDPNRYVSVTIADAGCPENAFGLYAARTPEDAVTKPLTVGNAGWRTEDRGALWSGRHYIEIKRQNVGDDGPSVAVVADALAAAHIRYGAPFWAESVLPKSSRAAGSFRFLRREALGYSFLESVFVAHYTDGRRAFTGEAPSSKEATRTIDRFAEILESRGHVQTRPGDSDSSILAGDYDDTSVQLAVFADDRFIYGTVGSDMETVLATTKEMLGRVRPAGLQPGSPRSVPAGNTQAAPMFPALPGLDWSVPENTRVYTPLDLWEKIDGRAELYLSFAMVTMTFGTYRQTDQPDNSIDVYWYDQGSADGAFGVFQAERGGHVTPVDVGKEGYVSAGSVFFWKGTSYVRVEVPDQSEALCDAGLSIARAIADSISDNGGELWARKLLPVENRVEDSFEFHAESAFGLEFLSNVFSATYDVDGRKIKVFVHRAESEEAAAKVLSDYLAFFEEYGTVVNRPQDGGRFLVGESGLVYDAVFVVGNYVGGSTGANDAESASRLAAMLRDSLTTRTVADK